MEQSKLFYPFFAACFFSIIFGLGGFNILLGAIIGLTIGYLFYYLNHLNAQLQELQNFIKQQNNPQPTTEIKPKLSAITQIAAKPAIDEKIAGDTPKVPATYTPSAIDQWIQQIFDRIKKYFTTGNVVVKVGIIVLLFGIGFLLQYAANYGWLPLKLRLAAAFALSIFLFCLGYKLRERRGDYGLALQGGAIGIFYLLIYISFSFYHLLAPLTAFLLACLISVFTITFALLQNSATLAFLALLGGFLAPYFIIDQELTTTVFYSYYTIINVVVLILAWLKSWRALNMLGFWFTFLIGILWGYYHYNSGHLIITEIFSSICFLIYVAISFNPCLSPIHSYAQSY